MQTDFVQILPMCYNPGSRAHWLFRQGEEGHVIYRHHH